MSVLVCLFARLVRIASVAVVLGVVAFFPAPAFGQQTATVSIAARDTYLRLDAENYGTSRTLQAYTWPDNQIANVILLKFDMSVLPPDAVVTDASLQLSLVGADGSPALYEMGAHKVVSGDPRPGFATGYTTNGSAPWTPSGCCYDGVPMAQGDIAPAEHVLAIDAVNGTKTWRITGMAQDWVNDPTLNYGVVLNADTNVPKDRYRVFASAENLSASLRPVLRVTYSSSDMQSPSVSITSPAPNAQLSNVAAITATVSDDASVRSVQYRLNGQPISGQIPAPFSANWNTATVSDGAYVLTAAATDTSGNVSVSAGVPLVVQNGYLVLEPTDTSLRLDTDTHDDEPVLTTYTWPDNKPANAILMKFDLSDVPAGGSIDEATLHLALVARDGVADGYRIGAHKVVRRNPRIRLATGHSADGVQSWSSSAVRPDNIPLAQADILSAVDRPSVDRRLGYKTWTITGMVREWVSSPAENYGVLLNADAAKPKDRYRYFASMEHEDASLRPYLRIRVSGVDAVAGGSGNGDTTLPSISITAPAAGATLSGNVALSATAYDNVGVVGVQFLLDGAAIGAEDTAAPFSITWSASGASSGAHTISAVARDAAGHRRTSSGVSVTVSNGATATVGSGIASRYPGDVGIESDPSVLFVERFDQASLSSVLSRYSDVRNGGLMSLASDVPPGSPGGRSLNIPTSSGGGHLYRQITPGISNTVYVRYYIKYPVGNGYSHTGVWMGGSNPPSAWPNPAAGTRPVGNDRFIAAAEHNPLTGRLDHYNYWMNMRRSADGNYWGNELLNNPGVRAEATQWTCVEQMVKLNNPVSASNGEHAIWINGVRVSHLGQGFPNGRWSGGIFTQDPTGSAFEGFRWRSDANLTINWIWLQNYAPNATGSSPMLFDRLVVATSPVGCLSGSGAPPPAAPGGDTTAPSVSISSPAAGATVSGTATIAASASDNVSVAGVQFLVNGSNLGLEDTSSPYSAPWDTRTVASGSYTLTAVARDSSGNRRTSSSRSVTVSNAGAAPAPGGSREPTGMRALTSWDFDDLLPVANGSIPGSPSGWGVSWNAAVGDRDGWALRVNDPSAPSGSTVYDFVYPTGMVEGTAPATVYWGRIDSDEVYVRFWWKPSAGFDVGPNGTKVAFLFNGGGPTGGQQFLMLRPDGKLHLLPEYPGDYRWRAPNVTGTVVATGVWHLVEWHANRSTGLARWWLDGVLQGSHTDVRTSYRFDEFKISPTFGGNSGARKDQTDHYWFDSPYISAR